MLTPFFQVFKHLDNLATMLPSHLEDWIEHIYAFREVVKSTMRMSLRPTWRTDHKRYCNTLDILKRDHNLTENVKSHSIRRYRNKIGDIVVMRFKGSYSKACPRVHHKFWLRSGCLWRAGFFHCQRLINLPLPGAVDLQLGFRPALAEVLQDHK